MAEKVPVPTDVGRLVLRLIVGLGIMTHGYSKLFGSNAEGLPAMAGFTQGVQKMGIPYSLHLAWAAALSEFAGGILVAAGLITRVAAFFICCTMIVAVYATRAGVFSRMELGLLYFAPALLLLLAGPGRY